MKLGFDLGLLISPSMCQKGYKEEAAGCDRCLKVPAISVAFDPELQ